MMDEKKLAYEAYTLVLKHSVWDGGIEHMLEEPIAVKCMVEFSHGNPTILINEMMDKMRCELMNRLVR